MAYNTKYNVPFLFLGMVALVLGIWSGLGRMGWQLPQPHTKLLVYHGPLMIGGFLGTLISLERAVVIKKFWAYLAPLFSGMGALLFIVFRQPGIFAPAFLTLGSLFLVFIFLHFLLRHPDYAMLTMAAGSVMWLMGNVLWLVQFSVSQVVWWWAGFLIITIAGERLELNRIRRLSPLVMSLFATVNLVFLLGIILSVFNYGVGTRIAGIGLIILTIWLLKYDLARRNIRQQGLTRFIGVALLTGYFWLGLGGVLTLFYGGLTAGPYYDAILHSIFVGFVFSMIFGHAPVIFPTVLGLKISYFSFFYIPLILLHLSLILRMVGDVILIIPLRQWGALVNGVAIVVFLISVVVSMKFNKQN